MEALEPRDVPATLVLPPTNLPTFTATFQMTTPGGNTLPVTSHPVSGGNFLGTLNGNTPLTASYCVNVDLNIFPNTTYANATVTGDGTVYGAAVPHASAISWLLTNIGPKATTTDQQDALQAAIWRTEYGTGFELDGVDNTNGAPKINGRLADIYRADLAALGNNTAPVSAVSWISPGANPGSPPSQGQGLVALTGTPTSPPLPPPNPFNVATGTDVTPLVQVSSASAKVGRGRSKVRQFTFTVTDPTAFATGQLTGVLSVQVRKGRRRVSATRTVSISDIAPGGSATAGFTVNTSNTSVGSFQVIEGSV